MGDERARKVLRAIRDRETHAFWYRPTLDGRPTTWGLDGERFDEGALGIEHVWRASCGIDDGGTPRYGLARPKRAWTRSFVAAKPADEGVGHIARLLVYDGEHLVACVGAVRAPGSRPFRRGCLRALSEKAPWMSEVLRGAWRREIEEAPPEVGDVVIDAGGGAEFASPGGRAWMRTRQWTGARPDLESAIASSSDAAGRVLSHGLDLSWTRMRGEEKSGYLVRVGLAPLLRIAPDAVLSPVERNVAARAAQGDKAAEIADSLGRSAGTIRSHLKAIYRKLGVSNRAELTKALEHT